MHFGYVVGGGGGFEGVDLALDFGPQFLGNFVGVVVEQLFRLVDQGIGLVAGFDFGAATLVVGFVAAGVIYHTVDVGLVHPGTGLDYDALLLAGAFVLGRHAEDAVGVDVESDFDLRYSPGRGDDAVQHKAADGFVVAGHSALALQHVDVYRVLVVGGGGEGFVFLGGDGGVAGD